MSNKNNENQNPQSAKVLKLGLNISVSGEPGTDFEIFLDDKKQKAVQLLLQDEQLQAIDSLQLNSFAADVPKHELETKKIQEVAHIELDGAKNKNRKILKDTSSSESLNMSELEKQENFVSQDTNIISQIKSTMEHFEKFSEHVKEIPRFRNCPIATSTPFSDKYNSKSESNLVHSEFQPRKYSHLYDFTSQKNLLRSSAKSVTSDLFLKPLPGEGYYKRGIYTRYFDFEPYRHYGSDNSLNKTSEYTNVYLKSEYDFEKYEGSNVLPEPLHGILKKSDSENGDKQSTSSADSVKDIKIYQSGGILIMQNFRDNMDVMEKKEISEFSAKLIENCNKLKMEVNSFQEDKPAICNSSDENKNSGKMVQFDLSSFEGQKSKDSDSPSNIFKDESCSRIESSESTSDCMKNKDSSPQETFQSHDFPSLSTQENDSVLSNQPGTSPTYASSKKLEWDSGADVGYLNLDLTKENLSTIEKIVLKGLSSDGQSEKTVMYEKISEQNQSSQLKFVLERKLSDFAIEKSTKPDSNKNFDAKNSKKKEKPYTDWGSEENLNVIEDDMNKNCERITYEHHTEGEQNFKLKETKSLSTKNSAKEISATELNEIETKKKVLESFDKSVNVNTLFDNADGPIVLNENTPKEFSKSSESFVKHKLKKAPKLNTSKNKRFSPQRLSKAPKKSVFSSINSRCSSEILEMGIPKKVYKKLEASPALNDVELSREVEEIIIDQRFKIKQDKVVQREATNEPDVSVKDKSDHLKEFKTKGRPISASSSSNNTVLTKSENKEHVEKKAKKTSGQSKFIDQIIQTNDYKCESVGVQAFASQMSGDCNIINSREDEISKPLKKENRESINTSSKNIQAFGLNASLPKQLEHSKETDLIDNNHTKSTQFFGGPLNSLPNYHLNLVTKPRESCGRVPNILKTKENSETEIIRMREENEKNILANDAPKLAELKEETRKYNNNENKENFINQKSTDSKRTQNTGSRKNSKEEASQDSEKRETEQKKKSLKVEDSDYVHTSDEVSSVILTSEILKVHGDRIDRNIIQEKYFQSQLVELEKKEMISRSTSMEMQLQLMGEKSHKQYMTIGCQYSPQSRGTASEEHYQEPDDDSFKENIKIKNRRRARLEHHDSSQNLGEERFGRSKNIIQERCLGAGDSLPSSTQTAHSWLVGMLNSHENTNGVGRARSFEYLPGHIYESSGNLREELPSETERNLITSSSDSDTAKDSVRNGRSKDSEGRNTLILENSTDLSHEPDRLKILDENLSQLNLAVLKLWEKDAQVQSVTQSLLANLWKRNCSGDFKTLGNGDSSKTEVIDSKDLSDNGKKRSDTFSETDAQEREKDAKKKEFSIACQTDEKSPSEPEKFYEERKALEKRINEEKESQIKWIENEINHLNILRELLEKRNSPIQTKKKLSPLTITSDDGFKNEINYPKYSSKEIYPRRATPVYGCTVSLTENTSPEEGQPVSEESSCQPKVKEPCTTHYGMAVSLSGSSKNWKPLIMLPIDLQVSLKNSNMLKECTNKDLEKGNDSQCHQYSSKSSKSNSSPLNGLTVHKKLTHSDTHTQHPSASKTFENFPSISVQTEFTSAERSNKSTQENCFCISLSGNSSLSVSRSSKSKAFEKKEGLKLHFSNEESVSDNENKTSNTTDPEFVEMPSRPVSQTKRRAVSSVDSSCKALHSTNCKCRRSSDQWDSSGSYNKQISIQNTIDKCQNSSKQLSLPISKSGATSKGICQANIYVGYKKSEEVRTCRCSKIQVQKSLNCSCHVIKIHGSKCCSSERDSCFCTKQSFSKKTESQYCQTDYNSLEKSLEVKIPDKSKIPPERKMSVLEKLPCDSKVEKVQSCTDNLEVEEKSTLERRIPEVNVPVKTRLNCGCKKRDGKEKMKADDQLRRYFLRVEETEVDDASELMEQKKSLEVITVTVPVKKAGKSKVVGSNFRQIREGNQDSLKPVVPDILSNDCKCCAECIENHKTSNRNSEFCIDSNYQRYTVDKPQSPIRNSGVLKPSKICSNEDNNFYKGINYSRKELSRQFSSSQVYSPARNQNAFVQPDSSNFPKFIHDSYELQCCEGCSCLNSEEIQSEYDSHKKARNSKTKEYYDAGCDKFHESKHQGKMSQDIRAHCDERRFADDRNSEFRCSRLKNHSIERDRCNTDYYNYNKREFMTKSEILKEEQKHKVQQSLQECLSSNRPDFYNSAERRRQIISEKAKARVKRHNNRMQCLLKMMQQCNESEQSSAGSRRIFTTVQMREQTMKRYKKLPEVVGKVADQKKKDEYRTNRLMADVFAKKLQIEALKGEENGSTTSTINFVSRTEVSTGKLSKEYICGERCAWEGQFADVKNVRKWFFRVDVAVGFLFGEEIVMEPRVKCWLSQPPKTQRMRSAPMSANNKVNR